MLWQCFRLSTIAECPVTYYPLEHQQDYTGCTEEAKQEQRNFSFEIALNIN